MSETEPLFLKRGITFAIFNSLGKYPHATHLLNNLAKIGESCCVTDFKIRGEKYVHLLLLSFEINSEISLGSNSQISKIGPSLF